MLSGKRKFYESNKISTTSAEFKKTSVFDTMLPDENVVVETLTQKDSNELTDKVEEIPGNENNAINYGVITDAATIPLLRRSGRFRETFIRLGYEHPLTDAEDADVAKMFVVNEPTSYKEAVDDIDREKLKAAMVNEMKVLREDDTWRLVTTSSEQKYRYRHRQVRRVLGLLLGRCNFSDIDQRMCTVQK